MVGPLMNTLPVRTQVAEDDRIRDLFARLQEYQLGAQQHAFSSLVQIQGWSEVKRGESLFNSILVVENYPVNIFEEAYGADWAGDGSLRIRPLNSFARTHYPLTLHVLGKSQIVFEFVYDRGLFTSEAIHLLIKQFQGLLLATIQEPHRCISELPVMSPEEQASLLVYSAGERRQLATNFRLNELISAKARRTPHAVAVESGKQSLTYSELDAR